MNLSSTATEILKPPSKLLRLHQKEDLAPLDGLAEFCILLQLQMALPLLLDELFVGSEKWKKQAFKQKSLTTIDSSLRLANIELHRVDSSIIA